MLSVKVEMTKTKNPTDLLAELQDKVKSCKLGCGGTGYILKGQETALCSCLSEAQFEFRVSKSGIPRKFLSLDFKDYMYKNSPTFAKVISYIDQAEKASHTGVGLVLVGSARAGKTLLAVGILKELMRRGFDCGFVSFGAMIQSLNESEKFVGTDVTFAVIDDVSKVLDGLTRSKTLNLTGGESYGVVEVLESVIAKRTLSGLPTILTSDVPILAIEQKFPRLGTTLLGNFLQVDCVADDFRGTKANEKLAAEFGFDRVI